MKKIKFDHEQNNLYDAILINDISYKEHMNSVTTANLILSYTLRVFKNTGSASPITNAMEMINLINKTDYTKEQKVFLLFYAGVTAYKYDAEFDTNSLRHQKMQELLTEIMKQRDLLLVTKHSQIVEATLHIIKMHDNDSDKAVLFTGYVFASIPTKYNFMKNVN